MSEDCISSSQNSNEITKEAKNGKYRKQHLEYPKNISFAHLNIHSL